MVDYCFYEKPTTSPVTVRKESALEENSKVQILSNNLIRMYYNTREESSTEVKTRIIDDYARKLFTSGYKLDQIRRIVLGGIRGYEGKLRKARELGRKAVHRSAKESLGGRLRRKLLGKSTWFKGRRKDQGGNTREEEDTEGGGPNEQPVVEDSAQDLEVRTVLFVEQTPQGELAKRLRRRIMELQKVLGFNIKVVERAGSTMRSKFPLNTL